MLPHGGSTMQHICQTRIWAPVTDMGNLLDYCYSLLATSWYEFQRKIQFQGSIFNDMQVASVSVNTPASHSYRYPLQNTDLRIKTQSALFRWVPLNPVYWIQWQRGTITKETVIKWQMFTSNKGSLMFSIAGLILGQHDLTVQWINPIGKFNLKFSQKISAFHRWRFFTVLLNRIWTK